MDPNEIRKRYEGLILHDANEAETRLKIIDQIIFDVLGWSHDDVVVEQRVSEDGKTTFADYVIRTGMTAIVVEAKRIGNSFAEVPNLRRTQLRGKIMSEETGEAIRQARDYARKLSIPFAACTNGSQWVVFPATRIDQINFADSSAIIFPSLDSVLLDDVAEFRELLSRDSVINGSLENELLGRLEDQIEERRLNRFFTTSFSKVKRNALFPFIESAVMTSFTDDSISNDSNLLEKCYVKTPERIKFDRRIRMHIAKRESVLPVKPKRPLRQKDERALQEIIHSAATNARPIAVLIMGLVGSGKTTFLNYTRRVSAADSFKKSSDRPYPHWIYVNFLQLSPDEVPIDFIFSSLAKTIQEDDFLSDYNQCIKYAYKEEIESLFRGPLHLLSDDESERKRRVTNLIMSDYEKQIPYVEKILRYVAANTAVFFVIDNVDQFESEDQQARVFGDAMAIAQRLGLNLILALRDTTYVRQKNLPIFDAFDFDPIYIDPPNVRSVLSRRFFVAKQILSGEKASFIAENGARMILDDVSIAIDLLQESVLGTEVGTIMEVLATSDIRL